MPLVSFHTPWKHQKTSGFLKFLRSIERDQLHELGYAKLVIYILNPAGIYVLKVIEEY